MPRPARSFRGCDHAGLLEGHLGLELRLAQELEPVDVPGRRREEVRILTPSGSSASTSALGRRVVDEYPSILSAARLMASMASAIEASLGITTSKLLRSSGRRGVDHDLLEDRRVRDATWLPSSVTSTVARVFSDLTTPVWPATVT